jgi:hypothetical protein
MTTVTLSNGTTLVDGTVPPGDTSATIAAGTTYLELDNDNIYLQGTLDNAGTLWLDSNGDSTSLILEGTTNTLTGGGTVLLSDNPNNRIFGAGGTTDTLINVNNTIEGAGQIGINNGNNPLALTNEAAGVIDANAANYSLVIETGGPAVVNDGLMEATNTGGLVFYGDTIDQTGGGKMLASGAGNVYFEVGADILGGTLRGTLGGEFIVTNGGASFGNSSSSVLTIAAATTVQVADNNNLFLSGTLDNIGTLAENSTGDTTSIILNSATVSLTGGGALLLSDSSANRILGSGGADETLINVNNTIEGAGQIGINNVNNPLALTNESAGIIDANQSVALVIATGGPALVNAGLIEATGTGGLVVFNSTIDNTGGTLLASGAGHNVDLQGSDIVGGLLRGTGGGLFVASGGATLDGSEGAAITIAASTTVQVADNNNLFLLGTIDNLGTLAENSTGDTTSIILDSATVSLTGGGTLLLSDSGANRIFGNSGADETLININNTIEGAGQIGINNSNNPLALTNESAGVIDANQSVALVIATGGPALVNAGLIEATGTGGLLVVNSTIDNTGGTLLASGAGNNVDLQNSDIVGGLLRGTGGGLFVATGATLDGSEGAAITIAASTTVQVADNNNLFLLGTIDNLGTLAENSAGDTTNIILDSATVSLTGGGTLLLSDYGANRIFGDNAADDTLININNTIVGAGQIGINNSNNPLALTNESAGVIDANQSVELVIATGGPTLINDGLLEATGSGVLAIYNTTVDQTGGGKILASGTAAAVYLENGADILGGTLRTTLGGEILITGGGASFGALTSNAAVTIAAATTVQVVDNNVLDLYGTVDNLGTLALDSTGDDTRIILNSPTVSLTGGGTLLLSNSGGNQIFGSNSTDDKLINVNNTIEGAGVLGINNSNNPLALTNEAAGVIDANQTIALAIETGGPTLINDGLLEATGAGVLAIYNTTVDQTGGGKILASGANAVVDIENGADILGGTLRTTLGGEILITGGGASFGAPASNAAVTIAAASTVQVVDNNILSLYGKVDNLGTLALDSTGDATRIILNAPTVSLTGAGTLLLSDNANNEIFGSNSSDDRLINVNNTIEGAGVLGINNGNNPLALTNESAGVIDANDNIALVIETGGPTLINDGLLEATGSGGLVIFGTSVTNSTTGTIAAHNGSVVQFDSNADLLNEVAGTLTGGVYAAYATTGSSTLEIAGGGALTTDAAKIILSGTGSEISFWNGSSYQTIESSLTDITGTGTLEIISGKTYVTAEELTVNAGGVLDVVSGTLNAAGVDFLSGSASRLIINAQSDIIGGFTAGGGTLELAADGTKVATLSANILGQLSDFGAVQIDTGAILDFTSSGPFGAAKVVDDGRIEATASSSLVFNGSTVTIGAAGTLEALGTSVVQFDSNADLQNEVAGTLTGGDYIVTGSAKLELAGGGALTTDAAEIILSGTNADISSWNGTAYQTIESSLTDITGAGTLEIIGGKHYTTANKLTINAGGVLDVASGTLKAGGVDFLSGSSSRLILNAQSDIVGSFTAGGGTLEVAADGSKIAKLSANILNQLSDFGVVTVDSGAILEFTTAAVFGATTHLENSGTITESSTGQLTIDGSLTGTGTIDISQLPLTLNGAVGAGQSIAFSGTSEVLDLGSPNSFSGTVTNFAAGDTIDLTSVPLGSITAMTFISGVLTLTEATGKIDIAFADPNQFGADHFALFSDGAGTGITLSSAAVAGAHTGEPALTHAGAAPWQPAISLASTALFPATGTLGG